jgi:hypothetical protein
MKQQKGRHIDGNHDNNENDDGVGGREAGRRETAINRAQGCDDPFGEWITDCVLMATRLEPNNGQTAHTKLSRVDEQEPLLNDLIRC